MRLLQIFKTIDIQKIHQAGKIYNSIPFFWALDFIIPANGPLRRMRHNACANHIQINYIQNIGLNVRQSEWQSHDTGLPKRLLSELF